MHSETKYLVNLDGARATMRVVGHASYLNCANAGAFFSEAAERGVTELTVDCAECLGMDSTFLGTLAGGALKLRETNASMRLVNLNRRNMELARNLGLENIMSVSPAADSSKPDANEDSRRNLGGEKAGFDDILAAHQTLASISAENEAKFEDVISFLKREMKK